MRPFRFFFVLMLAIAGISPVASARVGAPADALSVGGRPEIAFALVNRVPYLHDPDLDRCIVSHIGAMRPLLGRPGVRQVTMRWTFEPLPDADGSVKYIGPGSPAYPAPLTLKHPILIRVEINIGNTAVAHREVIALASCDPGGQGWGRSYRGSAVRFLRAWLPIVIRHNGIVAEMRNCSARALLPARDRFRRASG